MAPMPPLPENNTNRLWLDYTSRGKIHSCLIRLSDTAAPGNASQIASSVATVLTTRMLDNDSVFGARMSLANTNVSFPLTFTARPGVVTQAGNIWGQDPESVQLSLPMRAQLSGRKGLFTFFTGVSTTNWPIDNRYNPGDAAPIDTFRLNIITALKNAEESTVWNVVIDGSTPIYAGYINIASNAYHQRKQRRTGG